GVAAEERDDSPRAVGELHPERSGVEPYEAPEIGGEEQHVSELARGDTAPALRIAPDDLALHVAGAVQGERRVRGRGGRGFVADVHRVAVGIANPDAALRRPPRGIDLAHSRARE